MFVKYNGVLRGLQSPDSDFLKNTMVSLCCPKDVAEQFQGNAKIFQPANGELSFEQAKAALNRYTTTLHGINSAIIKLGKLTKATKVQTIRPLPLSSSDFVLPSHPDAAFHPTNRAGLPRHRGHGAP